MNLFDKFSDGVARALLDRVLSRFRAPIGVLPIEAKCFGMSYKIFVNKYTLIKELHLETTLK